MPHVAGGVPKNTTPVRAWYFILCLLAGTGSLGFAEEGLRDPFAFGSMEVVPVPATVARPKQSRLIGVLWDAKNPLAVIDGEPVSVGQQVRGWRVIAIQPNRVVIQRGDRKETLMTGDAIPTE